MRTVLFVLLYVVLFVGAVAFVYLAISGGRGVVRLLRAQDSDWVPGTSVEMPKNVEVLPPPSEDPTAEDEVVVAHSPLWQWQEEWGCVTWPWPDPACRVLDPGDESRAAVYELNLHRAKRPE